MAHELTIRSNGNAEMAYRGDVPWHGLGASLPNGGTIEEWTEAAGMNWCIQRGVVRYYTERGEDGPTGLQTMKDRHVLFRSDTKDALSIVSDDYKVVQPKQVAEFFRDLTEEAGFSLETMGTLKGGRKFWALARTMADIAILDKEDKVGGFVLLSTSADGSSPTDARFTAIRVVCQNTMSMAMRGTKGAHRVSHRSIFDPVEAKKALGLNVGCVRERFAEEMDTFRRLASKPLSKLDMIQMTLEVLGNDPKAMSAKEQAEAMAKPMANAIGTMALTGKGLKGADMRGGSNTVWAWLNAITQYVDHEARARSVDNRLDSAWFGKGDTIKTRAYEMAVQMVDGSTQYVTKHVEVPAEGASILDSVLDASPVAA
jgi:phage/plasmid-like protein (TIGR03299 family)